MAHPVSGRRAARGHRARDAAQSSRDRRFRCRTRGETKGQFGCCADEISARSDGRRRPDHGRDDRVLHLHDLHAEVPQAVGGALRQPDDDGHRDVADLCADFAADLRCVVGSHRPQAAADLVRRVRHDLHDTAAVRPPGDEERAGGLVPAGRGLADRGRLHLDQCGREGRTISDQGSRHWRRFAIRRYGVDLRGNRRVDRALVQVDRSRNLVLLLPHQCDCGLAPRLRDNARYQASVGDGPA